MAAAWSRRDVVAIAALAAAALATRVAARVRDLYSWDSGLLALGVEHYDFASYTPHPPYYPLTIFLAKGLASWVGPIDAITWLAVLASPILVAATYAVAREVAGTAVACYCALLAVLSPLLLFNGVVPQSYALEGAAATVVAWTVWRAKAAPSPRAWIAVALAASVAVGIRPSSVILLAPLVSWSILPSPRALAWTVGVGFVACLAWAIPMVIAGGGWNDFTFGLAAQSRGYIFAEPVWIGGPDRLASNLRVLGSYVEHELAFIVATALLAAVASLVLARSVSRRTAAFLAVWFLPGFAFYAFVYSGWPVYPSGYVVPLLPPLLVSAGLVLRATFFFVLGPDIAAPLRWGATLVVVAVAALPLAWPSHWDDAMRTPRAIDEWTASWSGLEQEFPTNETALVTFYGSTWVLLHHPDYLSWHLQLVNDLEGRAFFQVLEVRNGTQDKTVFDNLRDGPIDPPHTIPPWVKRVVLFNGHPLEQVPPLLRDNVPLHNATLASGRVVQWFEPDGFASIEDAAAWSLALPPPAAER